MGLITSAKSLATKADTKTKGIKVSEATGPVLDWLVAKVLGFPVRTVNGTWELHWMFRYSTDWSQGGPIIEQELANGMHLHGGGAYCVAMYYHEVGGGFTEERYGPTPLIAAMRCFVASKLGDEAEVPAELL